MALRWDGIPTFLPFTLWGMDLPGRDGTAPGGLSTYGQTSRTPPGCLTWPLPPPPAPPPPPASYCAPGAVRHAACCPVGRTRGGVPPAAATLPAAAPATTCPPLCLGCCGRQAFPVQLPGSPATTLPTLPFAQACPLDGRLPGSPAWTAATYLPHTLFADHPPTYYQHPSPTSHTA